MTYTSITTIWNGFIGAPGYTRLKFMGELTPTELNTCAAAVKTFWTSVAIYIPASITLAIQSTAQVYNDAGVLQSEKAIGTVPSLTTATASGTYAAGVGTVVFWDTGAIHAGGKVRGRTYLVPLIGSAFQSDGSLGTTALGNIRSAATTLVGTAPPLAVNSRKPPDGSGSNATVSVIGATVPDRPAVLRSRRD